MLPTGHCCVASASVSIRQKTWLIFDPHLIFIPPPIRGNEYNSYHCKNKGPFRDHARKCTCTRSFPQNVDGPGRQGNMRVFPSLNPFHPFTHPLERTAPVDLFFLHESNNINIPGLIPKFFAILVQRTKPAGSMLYPWFSPNLLISTT